jgi:hypothetical protein
MDNNGQEYLYYPELERQLKLAYFHLHHLRELIKRAEVREFPSESPLALLHLIGTITDKLDDKLTACGNRLKHPVAGESVENLRRKIWVIATAGTRLVALIRYVDAATVENVPWGLVGQFRRLCERMDPNLHIIIRPRWSFFHDHFPIKLMLKQATMRDPDIDAILTIQPFYLILSFPRAERNNMLQHAVWGHEVAHVLQQILVQGLPETLKTDETVPPPDELTLSSQLAHQITIPKEKLNPLLLQIQREFLIIPEVNEDHDAYEEMMSVIYNQVVKTLTDWVTEIVCDLLAIRLFGPAMLFAFSEIVESLHDLARSSDSHPSPAFRMRLMIEQLHTLGFIDPDASPNRWGGYGPVIDREIKRIQDLCSASHGNEESHQSDRATQIRFRIVTEALDDATLDKIRRFINGIKKDYFLDADKLEAEVPSLVGYLEQGIPPNKAELTSDDPEPVSLPAIVNAGWIFWLELLQHSGIDGLDVWTSSHPSQCGTLDTLTSQRERLNELVLKAIEASEIQHEYTERKRIYSASVD